MVAERKFHGLRVISISPIIVLFCLLGGIQSVSAQDVYRVGGNIALTGKVAFFGAYCFRGVEMGLQDLAQKGWVNGKKIEVIWEDNEYEPRKSIAAFNKLVTMDKVSCMITTGAPTARAIAPLCEQQKIVQLYTATSSYEIKKSGTFTFKMMGGQVTESLAMAKFAREDLKAKKAALITVDTEYGLGGGDLFEKYFKKMGGEILAREKVRPGERDFSSVLMKLNDKKPDILVVVNLAVDSGSIVKQARRLGIKAESILGISALYSSEFLTTAGTDAEGISVLAYQFDPEEGTPQMKSFAQNYNKKYGGFAPVYAAAAYDSLMLYAEAMKKGVRTGLEIKNFFRNVQNYEGVSGIINFDSDSEAMPTHRVLVIRGGTYKEVRRYKQFSESEM